MRHRSVALALDWVLLAANRFGRGEKSQFHGLPHWESTEQ
ncbi:hypothetical protein BLAT2472_20392 [Burkholderia latens]